MAQQPIPHPPSTPARGPTSPQHQNLQAPPPPQPYADLMNACLAIEAVASCHQASRDDFSPLQRYQSETVPAIPLHRYAVHLAARMDQGETGLMYGIVLFLRAVAVSETPITPDIVHRLLLASTVVAMKAHFDDFYVNKYMARIGGIESTSELKSMEMKLFFNILHGSAVVRKEDVRFLIHDGLVNIGQQIRSNQLNASGAARLVQYLLQSRHCGLTSETFDSLQTTRPTPPHHLPAPTCGPAHRTPFESTSSSFLMPSNASSVEAYIGTEQRQVAPARRPASPSDHYAPSATVPVGSAASFARNHRHPHDGAAQARPHAS
jgi:hypothetical protein